MLILRVDRWMRIASKVKNVLLMNYFNFKQILLDVALHTIAFIGLASFAVYYHVYGNGFILYGFV